MCKNQLGCVLPMDEKESIRMATIAGSNGAQCILPAAWSPLLELLQRWLRIPSASRQRQLANRERNGERHERDRCSRDSHRDTRYWLWLQRPYERWRKESATVARDSIRCWSASL